MHRYSRQPASIQRFELEDDETFEYNNLNTNYNINRFASVSPSRDNHHHQNYYPQNQHQRNTYSVPPLNVNNNNTNNDEDYDDTYDFYPKKWVDNSAKLARLREQRNKRLIKKIEVIFH